ncbi:MAG: hypothetical protein GX117_10620, partial [Candidatus Hydrogenedentes bacterium]|nr:hypothetical protein [Candidatus Hydrogenedentota bacterium]
MKRFLFTGNTVPKTVRVVITVCFLHTVVLAAAWGDLLDLYESDGILRDLIVIEGDLVEINTGSSPPLFTVDASPIGYL